MDVVYVCLDGVERTGVGVVWAFFLGLEVGGGYVEGVWVWVDGMVRWMVRFFVGLTVCMYIHVHTYTHTYPATPLRSLCVRYNKPDIKRTRANTHNNHTRTKVPNRISPPITYLPTSY